MTRLALLAVILGGCDSASPTRLGTLRGLDTAAMISLRDAVEIAEQRVPDGFAIEAALEVEEDDEEGEPPAYEVLLYVAADARLVEVEVHAGTGEVLEVEVEEDGDEDGEDDDREDD